MDNQDNRQQRDLSGEEALEKHTEKRKDTGGEDYGTAGDLSALDDHGNGDVSPTRYDEDYVESEDRGYGRAGGRGPTGNSRETSARGSKETGNTKAPYESGMHPGEVKAPERF